MRLCFRPFLSHRVSRFLDVVIYEKPTLGTSVTFKTDVNYRELKHLQFQQPEAEREAHHKLQLIDEFIRATPLSVDYSRFSSERLAPRVSSSGKHSAAKHAAAKVPGAPGGERPVAKSPGAPGVPGLERPVQGAPSAVPAVGQDRLDEGFGAESVPVRSVVG